MSRLGLRGGTSRARDASLVERSGKGFIGDSPELTLREFYRRKTEQPSPSARSRQRPEEGPRTLVPDAAAHQRWQQHRQQQHAQWQQQQAEWEQQWQAAQEAVRALQARALGRAQQENAAAQHRMLQQQHQQQHQLPGRPAQPRMSSPSKLQQRAAPPGGQRREVSIPAYRPATSQWQVPPGYLAPGGKGQMQQAGAATKTPLQPAQLNQQGHGPHQCLPSPDPPQSEGAMSTVQKAINAAIANSVEHMMCTPPELLAHRAATAEEQQLLALRPLPPPPQQAFLPGLPPQPQQSRSRSSRHSSHLSGAVSLEARGSVQEHDTACSTGGHASFRFLMGPSMATARGGQGSGHGSHTGAAVAAPPCMSESFARELQAALSPTFMTSRTKPTACELDTPGSGIRFPPKRHPSGLRRFLCGFKSCFMAGRGELEGEEEQIARHPAATCTEQAQGSAALPMLTLDMGPLRSSLMQSSLRQQAEQQQTAAWQAASPPQADLLGLYDEPSDINFASPVLPSRPASCYGSACATPAEQLMATNLMRSHDGLLAGGAAAVSAAPSQPAKRNLMAALQSGGQASLGGASQQEAAVVLSASASIQPPTADASTAASAAAEAALVAGAPSAASAVVQQPATAAAAAAGGKPGGSTNLGPCWAAQGVVPQGPEQPSSRHGEADPQGMALPQEQQQQQQQQQHACQVGQPVEEGGSSREATVQEASSGPDSLGGGPIESQGSSSHGEHRAASPKASPGRKSPVAIAKRTLVTLSQLLTRKLTSPGSAKKRTQQEQQPQQQRPATSGMSRQPGDSKLVQAQRLLDVAKVSALRHKPWGVQRLHTTGSATAAKAAREPQLKPAGGVPNGRGKRDLSRPPYRSLALHAMLMPGRFDQLQQQLLQLQQQHARLVGAAAGQSGVGQAKASSRPASPRKTEQGLVTKQLSRAPSFAAAGAQQQQQQQLVQPLVLPRMNKAAAMRAASMQQKMQHRQQQATSAASVAATVAALAAAGQRPPTAVVAAPTGRGLADGHAVTSRPPTKATSGFLTSQELASPTEPSSRPHYAQRCNTPTVCIPAFAPGEAGVEPYSSRPVGAAKQRALQQQWQHVQQPAARQAQQAQGVQAASPSNLHLYQENRAEYLQMLQQLALGLDVAPAAIQQHKQPTPAPLPLGVLNEAGQRTRPGKGSSKEQLEAAEHGSASAVPAPAGAALPSTRRQDTAVSAAVAGELPPRPAGSGAEGSGLTAHTLMYSLGVPESQQGSGLTGNTLEYSLAKPHENALFGQDLRQASPPRGRSGQQLVGLNAAIQRARALSRAASERRPPTGARPVSRLQRGASTSQVRW